VVLISHDRAFLRALTDTTLWLDRGTLLRNDRGFGDFEAWRDRIWAEEDTARHKLDRKIKAEARWAVEGISARRKRNQGRVRALKGLREERAAMIRRQGTADMQFGGARASGRKVIEAEGVTRRFGDKTIVSDFSFRVLRGDRVAFVGPNGAGKTTLVNMLTGQAAPDAGTVTLGTGIEMAVFDQTRAALDPEMTLWESLTGDRDLRVSGRADQVMVRGQPRHVVGYLKDFLFSDAQARAPVRSLSGGERARLLLARLMAMPSSLLVLDEPTNDLDVETLDLLEELVADYDGTVLLVSHDRDFVDRVATVTVAMEGDGRAVVYAGGWSDYRAQRGADADAAQGKPVPKKAGPEAPKPARKAAGLSFTERHRLEALPDEIAKLEAEVGKLAALLSDADLYTRDPAKFARATDLLADRQAALSAAEDEWLRLEEKAAET
jgi:ATP-binding cassette subfamily F protein uup